MGCTDSKAVSNLSPKNSVTNNIHTLKLKEWFERSFIIAPDHRAPYVQPSIPSHYLREEVTFDNENVDNDVWDRQLTIRPLATQLKLSEKEVWNCRLMADSKYSVDENGMMHAQIELDPSQIKCGIVAIGGLYLGGPSALDKGISVFSQIDLASTHTVVILGNLFDTNSLYAFHDLPSDITEAEEKIAKQCETELTKLKEIAESATVYYLRGSHDKELPRGSVERLLGSHIVYVQQPQLIITVKSGKDAHRINFTSGSQWDFLHYAEFNEKCLLMNKSIGYYLARASAQNPKFSSSKLIELLVSNVPSELSVDFLVQISKRPLQDKLTEILLKSAFQQSDSTALKHYKCIVGQGKYLPSESIMEYPYIKYLLEKINHDQLMVMMKTMAGDLSAIAGSIAEDVLITGLGDRAGISKHKGANGQSLITVLSGSCSNKGDKPTMVQVNVPNAGKQGILQIVEVKETILQSNGIDPSIQHNGISQKPADTISVESLE